MKTRISILPLLFLTLTCTVLATSGDLSNFSPNRNNIPLTHYQACDSDNDCDNANENCLQSRGMCFHQGLNYASFNNFSENPNIGGQSGDNEGPWYGDERKFVVTKYCPGLGAANEACDALYYNDAPHGQNPNGMVPNDVARFSVYYHNNGSDGNDAAEADSVDVGIELNDILVANTDREYRPRGYIYSPDNSYPGINTHTAKDDTKITMSEFGLILKPLPRSWTITGSANTVTKYTNASRNINLNGVNVTVTPTYENNSMHLHFSKIPGCFAYSGFAIFDAIVSKNLCESFTAAKQDTGNLKNGQKLYRLYQTSLRFAETGDTIPEGIGYKWTIAGGDGKLYTTANAQNFSTSSTTTTASEIWYTGSSPVSVKLVHLKADGTEASAATSTYLNPNVCNDDFDFPPPPPATCQNLAVTHTNNAADNVLATIGGQKVTVHKFTYTGLTFSAGQPLPGLKLKWTVTGDPNGRFYTKSGANYVAAGGNTNSYTTDNITAPKEIYYVGTGTVNVKSVKSDGTDDASLNIPACIKSFTPQDITYCNGGFGNNPPVQSRYVTVGGNQVYMHTLTPNAVPTYAAGAIPFPVGLKWTTSNGISGTFYTKSGAVYTAQANHQAVGSLNTTMYYHGAANDTITAKLVKTNAAHTAEVATSDTEEDQLNQTVCKTTFNIPATPVCNNMNLVVKTLNGAIVPANQSLNPSTIYELDATANYNPSPANPQNKFTSLEGLIAPDPSFFNAYIAIGGISKADAQDQNNDLFLLSLILSLPQTVPNGQSMYFYGFSDQQGPDPAFTVEAVNYANACNASKALAVTVPVCQS
ncbi:MAG: hypothetical protein WCX95_01205, partial [Candidatus Gracilibacteria bacterium]